MQCIREVDRNYPILFGEGTGGKDNGEPDQSIERVFARYYGWIYSATVVADHERISLDAAFELPVLQFLNAMAYMKMKNKVEEAQMERLKKKK